jgi:hypothetical protein
VVVVEEVDPLTVPLIVLEPDDDVLAAVVGAEAVV